MCIQYRIETLRFVAETRLSSSSRGMLTCGWKGRLQPTWRNKEGWPWEERFLVPRQERRKLVALYISGSMSNSRRPNQCKARDDRCCRFRRVGVGLALLLVGLFHPSSPRSTLSPLLQTSFHTGPLGNLTTFRDCSFADTKIRASW